MTARPSGVCPRCGRTIAGRMSADGRVILRSHNLANVGTKESNWGPAIPCTGQGSTVDLVSADEKLPGSG